MLADPVWVVVSAPSVRPMRGGVEALEISEAKIFSRGRGGGAA